MVVVVPQEVMDDDSDEVVKKTGKVKADDYIGAGDLRFDNAPVRCHGAATCRRGSVQTPDKELRRPGRSGSWISGSRSRMRRTRRRARSTSFVDGSLRGLPPQGAWRRELRGAALRRQRSDGCIVYHK